MKVFIILLEKAIYDQISSGQQSHYEKKIQEEPPEVYIFCSFVIFKSLFMGPRLRFGTPNIGMQHLELEGLATSRVFIQIKKISSLDTSKKVSNNSVYNL